MNPLFDSQSAEPRQEYERRLALGRAEMKRLRHRERRVGLVRVVVLVLFAVLLGTLFFREERMPIAIALAVVGGAVLGVLVIHQGILRALAQASWAATYVQRGLHRLDDDWSGRGAQGQRFFDAEHPYAADLDLFGPGSLFERLCTARTAMGEETLAQWLLAPAEPNVVRERQAAVADLRGRLDLRLDLGVQGGPLAKSVDFGPLLDWGAATPLLTSVAWRIYVTALGATALAVVLAWLLGYLPAFVLVVVFLTEMAVAGWLRQAVQAVVGPVERRGRALLLLQGLLARIESEPFTSAHLRRLADSLLTEGVSPSMRLAQLAGRVDWLDSRRNGAFAPIAALLLWTTQCAFALEAWRRKTGPALARWLAVVGEMEALASLATFAYENPNDPFPELTKERPCFDGEGLGHPLLTAACVRNDVHLGGSLRLLVVSGSNMSGKSTLLRTVGINTVLALAGATVRARRLRLCPLAVGGTLRIQDSLQAGRSRFYAEIVRVRQLVDLTRGPLPLLFLLDELLQGTNSHDRRLGAEGVLRSLLAAGAIGLITTHDLALTAIADQLGTQAHNVHFADHFENGAMTFDYRMCPGVVQKSNAVALMRAVGLNV